MHNFFLTQHTHISKMQNQVNKPRCRRTLKNYTICTNVKNIQDNTICSVCVCVCVCRYTENIYTSTVEGQLSSGKETRKGDQEGIQQGPEVCLKRNI